MLKKIGIGLLIVIALIIVISLFLPEKVTVERSVVINAPIEVVYKQVNNFKNWPNWSPWHKKDPKMSIEYSGPESGKGAKYCWDGDPDLVGKGCLSIVEATPNESIKTLLEFEGMTPGNGSWKFEKVSDGVSVSWSMKSDLGQPFVIGKYFGLMMDGMIGPDFESGLSAMKEFTEALPTYSIEIKEDMIPPITFIYVRDSADMNMIGPKMDEMAGKMDAYLKKNNLSNSGIPFAIWHKVGEVFEFSFAMPVAGNLGKGEGVVKTGSMEGFKCIKGDYFGDYVKMEGAYSDMERYLKDNSLEMTGEPIEFYVTDPMVETDTSKWLTQIVYPIK